MATTTAAPSKVHLTASQRPTFVFREGIKEGSTRKASELLQKNHEEHHIFFNQSGFHNHIVHHLLTLLALGATPAELQAAYDENASYQRPPVPTHERTITDLRDKSKWPQYLTNEEYYHDFLVYFQDQMKEKGWQDVLNEYLFAGDERADDLLIRTFAGFLHPLIHLGFGVEFEQPAIIAEALAQAAAHDTWISDLLLEAEKAATTNGNNGNEKSIMQLIYEIRGNEKLKSAAHWSDGNKIRDGILARAPQEMIEIAKQFTVKEEELERKTAEMINAAGTSNIPFPCFYCNLRVWNTDEREQCIRRLLRNAHHTRLSLTSSSCTSSPLLSSSAPSCHNPGSLQLTNVGYWSGKCAWIWLCMHLADARICSTPRSRNTRPKIRI